MLNAERQIRENSKREKEIKAKTKSKIGKTQMLYRLADSLKGAERDAYILRRTADKQNYLADVMSYKIPTGKNRKRIVDAFNYYSKPNGSQKINNYMTKGRKPKNDGLNGRIKAMEEWINNNPLPENKVVYRSFNCSKEKIEEYLKNNIITGLGGFQSFSSSFEHSTSFIEGKEDGVVLILSGKKGDKIAPPLRIEKNRMVGYSEEQEYNVGPSTRFKINKSSFEGKICYINCTILNA